MFKRMTGLCILICIAIILFNTSAFAYVYEDQNSDGIIIRIAPPPGREYIVNPPRLPYTIVTGYPLRDLMENPDDWDVTRSVIDYFGYASWILNDNFSNAELTSYFSQFDTWDLNFVLGVSALKNLNWARTGEQCYAFESTRWERYDSLGLTLAGLGIDEPLTAAIAGSLGVSEFPTMTDVEYAIRETADWLELVRADSITANLPISLFETYPRTIYPGTCKDDLLEFIEGLRDECDNRGIEGISDLALDYNWYYGSSNYWNEVIEIEEYADSIGLDFAMIFWPARSCYPGDTDEDFLLDILYQGSMYFDTCGGSPDIIEVTAWDYIPVQQVPESYTGSKPIDDFPFTYSFLQFYNIFIDVDCNISNMFSQVLDTPTITSLSPNPTKSSVTIHFNSFNPSSRVRFEAFDIFGRLITDREVLPARAGDNTFTWDSCNNNGEQVPTGVYFVKLIINGQATDSSRLLLVK